MKPKVWKSMRIGAWFVLSKVVVRKFPTWEEAIQFALEEPRSYLDNLKPPEGYYP